LPVGGQAWADRAEFYSCWEGFHAPSCAEVAFAAAFSKVSSSSGAIHWFLSLIRRALAAISASAKNRSTSTAGSWLRRCVRTGPGGVTNQADTVPDNLSDRVW